MTNSYQVSREKHLDHMIKVVPLIVLAYALQCYIILHVGANTFATDSLIFLGLGLCSMIAGFITYDLHHKVMMNDTHLEISFKLLGYARKFSLNDIKKIDTADPDQNFSTVTIWFKDGNKISIFFADDAAGIKKWIENRQLENQQLAA